MATTKVFRSGNSQAVRIPKEFQLQTKEVEIFRRGDEIVLRPKPKGLGVAFDLLTSFSDDFFKDGRNQPPLERRPRLR